MGNINIAYRHRVVVVFCGVVTADNFAVWKISAAQVRMCIINSGIDDSDSYTRTVIGHPRICGICHRNSLKHHLVNVPDRFNMYHQRIAEQLVKSFTRHLTGKYSLVYKLLS